jgi:hypothetical protein
MCDGQMDWLERDMYKDEGTPMGPPAGFKRGSTMPNHDMNYFEEDPEELEPDGDSFGDLMDHYKEFHHTGLGTGHYTGRDKMRRNTSTARRWITAKGDELLITEMDTDHLLNTVVYLNKKINETMNLHNTLQDTDSTLKFRERLKAQCLAHKAWISQMAQELDNRTEDGTETSLIAFK